MPSQAIAVYKESSEQIKECTAEWDALKETKIPLLNRLLRDKNLSPVTISEIDDELENVMSR